MFNFVRNKEMNIRTTTRYYFPPIKLTKLESVIIPSIGEMMEWQEASFNASRECQFVWLWKIVWYSLLTKSWKQSKCPSTVEWINKYIVVDSYDGILHRTEYEWTTSTHLNSLMNKQKRQVTEEYIMYYSIYVNLKRQNKQCMWTELSSVCPSRYTLHISSSRRLSCMDSNGSFNFWRLVRFRWW